jgi:hypothetical protein
MWMSGEAAITKGLVGPLTSTTTADDNDAGGVASAALFGVRPQASPDIVTSAEELQLTGDLPSGRWSTTWRSIPRSRRLFACCL